MIITFLTDFGLKDSYVGIMKGVIYSIYPDAKIVDITHEVAPQNVTSGAFLLYSAYHYFPPGTVHIAVVDPSVGTKRRAIALQVPEIGYFVGPDNGIFHYILATYKNAIAREITNPAFMLQPVSRTFHGRDIFAPTAAQLAKGKPF